MKWRCFAKIGGSAGGSFWLFATAWAQSFSPPLLSDPLAVTTRLGKVAEESILADPQGQLFLKVPAQTRVIYDKNGVDYHGDLLPPNIFTTNISKPPDLKFRETLTFEFLGQSADRLKFIDPSYKFPTKLRNKYHFFSESVRDGHVYYGAGVVGERLGSIEVFLLLRNNQSRKPILWEYLPESNPVWIRRGGVVEELDNGDQLFRTQIFATGTYVLYDEDPPPIPAIPFVERDQIELSPIAPYYSVPLDIEKELLTAAREQIPDRIVPPTPEADLLVTEAEPKAPLIPAAENPFSDNLAVVCNNPALAQSSGVIEQALCDDFFANTPSITPPETPLAPAQELETNSDLIPPVPPNNTEILPPSSTADTPTTSTPTTPTQTPTEVSLAPTSSSTAPDNSFGSQLQARSFGIRSNASAATTDSNLNWAHLILAMGVTLFLFVLGRQLLGQPNRK